MIEQLQLHTGELINKFETIDAASNVTGVSVKMIGSALNGWNRSAGDFLWRYEGGEMPDLSPKKRAVEKLDPLNLTVLETFPSIGKASEMTGASLTKIGAAANHARRSCGGFLWHFVGDPRMPTPLKKRPRLQLAKQPVMQLDLLNGMIIAEFESINQATLMTGISHDHIRQTFNKERSHAGGYGWQKKTDGQPPRIANISMTLKPLVEQIDIETGAVLGTFSKIADASRHTGVHDGNICCVVKGKHSSAGGFGWRAKYLDKVSYNAFIGQRARELKGDALVGKLENCTRLYFHNVNGISPDGNFRLWKRSLKLLRALELIL